MALRSGPSTNNQPAAEFRPIQNIVDRAVSPRRFFILLVAGFAGLGLLLAALGIYGVISYSVTQRTQEIGIRVALGASAAQVQFGVIGKTLLLTLVGIAKDIFLGVDVTATHCYKTNATNWIRTFWTATR